MVTGEKKLLVSQYLSKAAKSKPSSIQMFGFSAFISLISDLRFAPESSFGKNVMFCVRALAACNCCRDPHPGFRMEILILTCESEHALQHHLKEFMVQSYLLSVIAGLLLHWKTNLHCLL